VGSGGSQKDVGRRRTPRHHRERQENQSSAVGAMKRKKGKGEGVIFLVEKGLEASRKQKKKRRNRAHGRGAMIEGGSQDHWGFEARGAGEKPGVRGVVRKGKHTVYARGRSITCVPADKNFPELHLRVRKWGKNNSLMYVILL